MLIDRNEARQTAWPGNWNITRLDEYLENKFVFTAEDMDFLKRKEG